jgi:hypothetical protein
VEQARIQREGKILQARQGAKGGTKAALFNLADDRAKEQQAVLQLIQRTYIKPGVYRLNKPWEVQGGPGVEPVGCGLLARLGLPTVVEIDFRPAGNITR